MRAVEAAFGVPPAVLMQSMYMLKRARRGKGDGALRRDVHAGKRGRAFGLLVGGAGRR